MTGDIEIKSRDGFRSALSQLRELHGKIPAALDGSKAVTTAVTAAGGAGEAGASGTGGSVAPIYTTVLSALAGAADGVAAQVGAAGGSLGTAATDLQTLLDGLSVIDDSGAAKITRG